MESVSEFQLLKLKVASEFVRSSQAVVAFSRAFYLEEVVIDKIGNEVKDLKRSYSLLQKKLDDHLKTAHLEDNIVTETNLRLLCSTIQSELDRQFDASCSDLLEEFEKRVLQAEARRQAKSSLLQQLSSSDIMSRFETLTLDELRTVQVPEFSCFINESDFGLLEKLNEEWNQLRKEMDSLFKRCMEKIDRFKTDNLTVHRHNLASYPSKYNRTATITSIADLRNFNYSTYCEQDATLKLSSGETIIPEDEIGKTFASNRSGSVFRKFSSLLRRGKSGGKTITSSRASLPEEPGDGGDSKL